jgi:spore coat protein CotF
MDMTQTCAQNGAGMAEQQKLNDLLTTEKSLSGLYNTYYAESATGAVRSCLSSILSDEHRIGEELFQEMNSRGWYPVEKAEEAKINSTKQKFSKSVTA